jgi:hypothetical protein
MTQRSVHGEGGEGACCAARPSTWERFSLSLFQMGFEIFAIEAGKRDEIRIQSSEQDANRP